MKSKHFATIAAGIAALAAASAHAQAAPATLTVVAEAGVQGVPDVADIGAGVVTQAPEASAALSSNADKMSRVAAALRKAGVAERDIQTSGLNLQPQYRYEPNKAPALLGYQVSNRVSVTLRDLRQAGKIIDTLVAEGANQVDGPNFRIDKPEPLMDQARAEAVRIGRARADLYAKAAALKVKRILSISELGAAPQMPFPAPAPRDMMVMAAKADSPIAPGELRLAASLTMVFELE